MKFSLFTNYGALNSKPVFDAFEESLVKHGYEVKHNDVSADVAVIWSVLWHGRMFSNKEIWKQFRSKNKNVIVLEVGGIKRGTTWKVGINGVNKDAYPWAIDCDGLRAQKLELTLKPWNKSGEFVLICGQHEKSLQWESMPRINKWFMNTIESVQKVSNRPILIRPHPRSPVDSIEHYYKNVYRQCPSKVNHTYDDYDLDFKNIWTTISWSSNPGIQSIISGIPAITGPESLAYSVSTHSIEQIEFPSRPDREQWLNNYAWSEFTLEEIRKGIPLANLTKFL
jgi:hypothetical protein